MKRHFQRKIIPFLLFVFAFIHLCVLHNSIDPVLSKQKDALINT